MCGRLPATPAALGQGGARGKRGEAAAGEEREREIRVLSQTILD